MPWLDKPGYPTPGIKATSAFQVEVGHDQPAALTAQDVTQACNTLGQYEGPSGPYRVNVESVATTGGDTHTDIRISSYSTEEIDRARAWRVLSLRDTADPTVETVSTLVDDIPVGRLAVVGYVYDHLLRGSVQPPSYPDARAYLAGVEADTETLATHVAGTLTGLGFQSSVRPVGTRLFKEY